MWSYSTNFMGPTGLWWYDKYNIPYKEVNYYSEFLKRDVTQRVYKVSFAGGRIDCYCDNINDPDYSKYGEEISLPIMLEENYNRFSDWLYNFTSEKLLTFEELRKIYEKENGKLVLFKEYQNNLLFNHI